MAVASASIYVFLELPVPHTIFFPTHQLLSHITIVETTVSTNRRMNLVAVTIINPWEKNWLSQVSNKRPLDLKSCTLSAERHWVGCFLRGHEVASINMILNHHSVALFNFQLMSSYKRSQRWLLFL